VLAPLLPLVTIAGVRGKPWVDESLVAAAARVARGRRSLSGRFDSFAQPADAFRASLSLTSARAIASMSRGGALALSRGAAGRFWRRNARILAHAAIAYAGEEQDLCAAVGRDRTTMMASRLKADELTHNSALVGIDAFNRFREFRGAMVNTVSTRSGRCLFVSPALCINLSYQKGFQVACWVNFR
jgi:hypothetical protein